MRLMVASDIHGSAYYGKKLLEAYDREQADRLLLLGDILYHGPRNTWLYDAGRGWYQMENIRRKDYIVKCRCRFLRLHFLCSSKTCISLKYMSSLLSCNINYLE